MTSHDCTLSNILLDKYLIVKCLHALSELDTKSSLFPFLNTIT